jgi:hypothetical protein
VARTHLRTDSPLKHVRGLRAAAPIDCPVWCLAKRTALCTRSSDRRGAHDPRRRAKPSSERPSAASRSGERARGSPGWRECLIEPGTHRPTRRAADHLTPKRSHGGPGERRRHDNRQPTRWSHPRTARSSALRGAGSAEPGELRSSGQVGHEDVVWLVMRSMATVYAVPCPGQATVGRGDIARWERLPGENQRGDHLVLHPVA